VVGARELGDPFDARSVEDHDDLVAVLLELTRRRERVGQAAGALWAVGVGKQNHGGLHAVLPGRDVLP
jgi:hypothetical protein